MHASIIIVTTGFALATAASDCKSATFLSSVPSQYKCNASGHLKKPLLLSTAQATDLNACATDCLNAPTCKTFGYDGVNGTCQMYVTSFTKQDYVHSYPTDFAYWNVNCVACASSTSSIESVEKASSTSSTSSSTKKSSTSSVANISISSAKSSSSANSSSSVTSSTSAKASSSVKSSSSAKSTSSAKPTSTSSAEPSSTTSKTTSSTKPTTTSTSTKTKTPKTKTTSTATATATTIPTGACNSTAIIQQGLTYTRYYIGSGYTLSLTNPGNDASNEPAITTTYLASSVADSCAALTKCITLAVNDEYIYYSIDLHLLNSTQEWVCVQYYDPSYKTEYWNVSNADVSIAYGFYNPEY